MYKEKISHNRQSQIPSNRLAELLLERDLKRSELAEMIDEDPSVVSSWITGKRNLSDEKRLLIAKALDVDVDIIIDNACSIPIVATCDKQFHVHAYRATDKSLNLKCRTIRFPSYVIGILEIAESEHVWWNKTIHIVPHRKKSWIEKSEIHPVSDNHMCYMSTTAGKQYIGIPRTNGKKWSIHSPVNTEIESYVDLLWSVPLLASIPNWSVMDLSFVNTLED